MKYLVFWEFNSEDFDKVIQKSVKAQKESVENPDKYVKYLLPPHSIGGQNKGFSVVEGTSEQIINGVLFWRPELKLKYMPIFDTATIIEQHMKSK